MAPKLTAYIRRNHLGLLAVFIALGGTAYAGSQVQSGDIATDAVRSRQIKDGAVRSADVADGSLTGADVADGGLTRADIADGAVTGATVADGSLSGADVANGGLTAANIDTSTLPFLPVGGAVDRFVGRFGDPRAVTAAPPSMLPQCILGEVVLFAGYEYPPTFEPADGRIEQISQNVTLFSLLGTDYGGNGTSTFALPDLRPVTPDGMVYLICVTGVFP